MIAPAMIAGISHHTDIIVSLHYSIIAPFKRVQSLHTINTDNSMYNRFLYCFKLTIFHVVKYFFHLFVCKFNHCFVFFFHTNHL